MRTSEFHRAVARATGESVAAIRRRGFSLLSSQLEEFEDVDPCDFGPGAGSIDWDAFDAERAGLPPWSGVSLSAG